MTAIVLDAMGGDKAPEVVIEGTCQALDTVPSLNNHLILVGDQERVNALLSQHNKTNHPQLEVVHASQVVDMNDPASMSLRTKRNSSILISADLIRQARANGLFSAGHTGAAVGASVLKMRMLPCVDRPGIATIIPSPLSQAGKFLIIDAGANIDSKPKHLLHYGLMGEVYAQNILGIEKPRVGLLNVGDEEGKGNSLVKETFAQLTELSDRGLNFVGNIEGDELFCDKADVVVCDGFVGNAVLKCSEGLAHMITGYLKTLLTKTALRKMGAMLSKSAYEEFKSVTDSAEYGGAPLLGVNGICIIGHGSSSAKAVRNAIVMLHNSLEHDLNELVEIRFSRMGVGKQGLITAEGDIAENAAEGANTSPE